MGLTLHVNLFRCEDPTATLNALQHFHEARGFSLLDDVDVNYCYRLHVPDTGWVLLDLPNGWNWDLWRQAHLHISRQLRCAGFLIFV